jgi:cystathionine gamma-synthase
MEKRSRTAPADSGGSTRSVHAGERDHQATEAVTTPIYQTSTFWFENSEKLRAFQEGRDQRDEYGRYGNPTWRAVERKLSDLEGGEEAVLFASGMCAATTLFLALLPRGGHLVITSDCYRRTRQFIREYLVKLDIETTVIDPADTEKLAAALRDDTSLFFTESPTNPYLRVIDVPEAVRLAHARGAKVVIDSTFATPLCHRPLELGADYAIHSATKYLGGHNDLLAGVVVGSSENIEPVRKAVGVLGGVLDSNSAYLLLRGLKTLSLRMQQHCETGLRVARWLEEQPAVRRVWYPGLPSHPDHETAQRTMTGFGGVVTFELESDFDGACRFVDACRIPYIAPSLGGVESLIEMPALMSFWDQKPEVRRELGITDSLIRFACGVEDADDLIADVEQALGKI